jgi:hypothetical protein
MGARAFIAIDEINGTQNTEPRWFRAASASPEFQIPHLADFYTWTIEQRLPLTEASYLRYAADNPGTLLDDESATPGRLPGDLDYLYRLTLNEDQHGLCLRVHDLSTRPRVHAGTGQPIESLTQGDLYGAAARWCDTVAQRCERYAASNAGIPMPGGEPQTWIARAAAFRQRQQSTPIRAVAANLAAQCHPATFDTVHPAIQVAGVWVFAYIDGVGVLRVSVHLDETEQWLLRADSTVPTRITIEATDVFTG